MLAIITAIVAIFAAAAGVGAFLDKHASDDTKSLLWSNIERTDLKRLSAASIETVALAYEAIFFNRIKSWKFFRRSVAAYFVILTTSLAYLLIMEPIEFARSTSFVFLSDAGDVLVSSSVVALGGFVFWAANAQTLYFLRLARSDPRPTPAILIFYADTLLTGSICVFGIGALLWLHTTTEISSRTHDIALEARVLPVSLAVDQDLKEIERFPRFFLDVITKHIKSKEKYLGGMAVVATRNIPSESAKKLFRADHTALLSTLKKDGIRVVSHGPDSAQFFVGDEIFSFSDLDTSLKTGWRQDFKTSISADVACRQMAHVNTAPLKYVKIYNPYLSPSVSLQQCQAGVPFTVHATVGLNKVNIITKRVLITRFRYVFERFVGFITTDPGEYASINPMAAVNFERRGGSTEAWADVHYESEIDHSASAELDGAFLRAYLAEEGIQNQIATKQLPAKPMIFAVMSTSIFTILMLLGAGVAIITGASARMLNLLNRRLLVQKYPFTFVLLLVGVISSLVVLSGAA
jgi:hypothetical protein